MKSVYVHLKILKQLFPSKEAEIEKLYENDAVFRDLCNDYTTCLDYQNKFQTDYVESKESLTEIEKLRRDLEKDLNEYLKANHE